MVSSPATFWSSRRPSGAWFSVYEFDAAGKIRHLDIYLQRER